MAALDIAKHRKRVADMLVRETTIYEQTKAALGSSTCASERARIEPLLEANAERVLWLGKRLLQLTAAVDGLVRVH
jgi:hypothetical protein